MRIGGNANGGIIKVSSDPDGTLTAQRGTLAIDTTTGVTWKNRSGTTMWDPVDIPLEYGTREFYDFEITQTPWSATTVATGSGGPTPVSFNNRLGVLFVGASAVADVGIVRGSNNYGAILGGGKAAFRAAAAITSLSDGTNDTTHRIGWGDSTTSADHVDGVYFECSRATYGNNNWRFCTASNSVRTKTDTGVAPTAAVYQAFEIRANAAGTSVDGYINGVLVATITTNIPNAVGRDFSPSFQAVKDLGAAARFANMDYAGWWHVYTTARL